MKKILRILIKWGLIAILGMGLLYFANYHRLASAFNPNRTSTKEIEEYIVPGSHRYTSIFSPDVNKIKPPTNLFRVTDEIPYMGTHYVDAKRYLDGFDPERPDGIITWQGKVVAYQYYSSEKIGGYHWHKHKNLCGTENMVVKYEYSFWQCLFKGYLPFPNFAQKYMIHVWIVPNPAGVNDMWNPLLTEATYGN